MEKKRKLPARAAARVDAVSKKRTSTPPEQPTPPPQPAPVVEEPLPKTLVAGKPLPTVHHPQPANLSNTEFQSISESGVMAESLERSRKKWLSQGIFERYWTKPPPKKKNIPYEEPKNPPKDSMTKIGTCSITIEPHSFDAVMYTIKETSARASFQPPPPPTYRPIMQYGPPNGMMPPPTPASPALQQQATHTQQSPHIAGGPQRSPANADGGPYPAPSPSMGGIANPQNSTAAPVASSHPEGIRSASSNGASFQRTPAPQAVKVHSPAQRTPPSSSPAPPPAKSSDPVIQMLAERAATDQDLKALMRIVADGKASSDELKRFQAHIDELTKLLHTRQAAAAAAAAPPPPPPPPAAQNHNVPQAPNHIRQLTAAPSPLRAPQATHMYNNNIQTVPQPQALRSKGPAPPPKPDISGVAFEFVGGSGDRFLFPKYSILEYTGGPVIASFLIVRKGSNSDAKSYDPQLDYYQPVTIRIYANQPRLLDTLAKAVAHPDEVRRYMDDIMDNMTRAEYVLLAMQLPRDGERIARHGEDVNMSDAPLDNQVMWTASANGEAAKHKPVKKVMNEQEQYMSFISTIS